MYFRFLFWTKRMRRSRPCCPRSRAMGLSSIARASRCMLILRLCDLQNSPSRSTRSIISSISPCSPLFLFCLSSASPSCSVVSVSTILHPHQDQPRTQNRAIRNIKPQKQTCFDPLASLACCVCTTTEPTSELASLVFVFRAILVFSVARVFCGTSALVVK